MALDHSLGGKGYADMCDIFQCGYEKLLGIVYPVALRAESETQTVQRSILSRRGAVQVTYSTLYKHVKLYDKTNPSKALCKMIY